MKKIILVDMENTLSDSNHRGLLTEMSNSNDWNMRFMDDLPSPAVKAFVELINVPYMIISCKPIEYQNLYVEWLSKYMDKQPLRIYMRALKDHRPSWQIKEEWLQGILTEFEVVCALDDRQNICAMYRRHNIPTFHYKNTL